jgi:hypothetical protein
MYIFIAFIMSNNNFLTNFLVVPKKFIVLVELGRYQDV